MLKPIRDKGGHLGYGITLKINNISQRENFWQVASDLTYSNSGENVCNISKLKSCRFIYIPSSGEGYIMQKLGM